MATRGTGEKVETESLIRKIGSKQEGLDLEKERETFIATRRDFIGTEASTSLLLANLKVDEEVKPFLQACMKLLRNPKAVQNLQALIDSCATRPTMSPDIKDVHKLYRYKKHTGREMRLTAQISDYKMDWVILDLGSDANV